MAFPLLVGLVAVVVILGVLQYWVLLALGSAIYLAFLGWRHWQGAPAAARRKPRVSSRRTAAPKRARARRSRRR